MRPTLLVGFGDLGLDVRLVVRAMFGLSRYIKYGAKHRSPVNYVKALTTRKMYSRDLEYYGRGNMLRSRFSGVAAGHLVGFTSRLVSFASRYRYIAHLILRLLVLLRTVAFLSRR